MGMAGAGKTTCALELAYTHHESFPNMAWYRAPDGGPDISTALAGFVLALELQLNGFRLLDRIADPAAYAAVLPAVTELMERERMLIVLDNAESLLTADGEWRDDRWRQLVAALTDHRGLSRLVITSRLRPAELPDTVLVEAVHALSLAESVLLARELPHLAALIDATDPPAGLTAGAARDLAARTLTVVQGHPTLIELAEGHAATPSALSARLDEASRTWLTQGSTLQPFLDGADPEPVAADYLSVLHGWARGSVDTLSEHPVTLFRLLCCMEEIDREWAVLDAVWPDIWHRLHGPSAPPPPAEPAVVALADQALLARERRDPDDRRFDRFRIHPGIAEAIRNAAPDHLRAALEDVLADYWLAVVNGTLREEQGGRHSDHVRRATWSAAPYLLRRQRWRDLGQAAEVLLGRDTSAATATTVLPMLATAVEHTHGTNYGLSLGLGRLHALTLSRLDSDQGEARMRELLDAAVSAELWDVAHALAGDLIYRLFNSGRYDEALRLADRRLSELTPRVGQIGPWSELVDRVSRLQILATQGHHQQVLDEVEQIRAQMSTLPDSTDGSDRLVTPWNVREGVVFLGMVAAGKLGRWQLSLDLSAELQQLRRRRDGTEVELADARFADYDALVGLGKPDEARRVLIDCREVYEAAGDVPRLARTMGALAQLEAQAGRLDRAVDLEIGALRYGYLACDPSPIAASHHNLAVNSAQIGAPATFSWAHAVAAAIIRYQTGDTLFATDLEVLRWLASAHPGTAPTDFAEVRATIEDLPGLRLTALLDRLPHRAPDPAAALDEVFRLAGPSTPPDG